MKKWLPSIAWRDIERILLLVGVLGAFAALATGDTAEHLVHPNRALVEDHSTFGALATWIYGALLLGEIAAIINAKKFVYAKSIQFLSSISILVEKILCNKVFSIVLAILGFIAISLTGLLGGVIAYGVTADPFAATVLKILGITL